ncbi:MAG: Gfo/Idh/MocA family oxidoreductase [Verrucomicrobiae bacterium]|nr:Gfo/Idh/MocA family oxidoreductase [Verrucomicrobiae bacterium]
MKTALVAGAAVAFPAIARATVVAPSERITLGVIGLGPRCQFVLRSMLEEPDLQCLAVCDVQASRRELGKKIVDDKYGNTDCATYRDFRELLARPDIDATLIATGENWHALAAVLAAQAGKDIYCEKPCAMTITECRILDETIHRYSRVFQTGTQRRSISNFRLAVHLARSGKLGKLRRLHASVYDPLARHEWLPAEPEPPREQLDWDMWIGPAPWRPYNSRYVTGRGWQGFADFTAGANLMDWGVHTVDLCQWANDADGTAPLEYEPAQDKIVARYANGVILELNYGRRVPQQSRSNLGAAPIRFEGDEGWVETGDTGVVEVHPPSLRGELRRLTQQSGIDVGNHVRNFLDCIRTRAQPNASSRIMRCSHLACFAAAIAWQLNRKVVLDPVTETFPGDSEANRLRFRAYREPWRL